MAAFTSTFSDDGIFGQACWGWRLHSLSLSLYLPPPVELWRPLYLLNSKTSERYLPLLLHFAPLPFSMVSYTVCNLNGRKCRFLTYFLDFCVNPFLQQCGQWIECMCLPPGPGKLELQRGLKPVPQILVYEGANWGKPHTVTVCYLPR